jgi:hypothetical protein
MAHWCTADLTFSGYGPERVVVRLVVATTDPATLPAVSTWYLTTNLPRPGSARAADWSHASADLRRSCACMDCGTGSSMATNR